VATGTTDTGVRQRRRRERFAAQMLKHRAPCQTLDPREIPFFDESDVLGGGFGGFGGGDGEDEEEEERSMRPCTVFGPFVFLPLRPPFRFDDSNQLALCAVCRCAASSGRRAHPTDLSLRPAESGQATPIRTSRVVPRRQRPSKRTLHAQFVDASTN